MRVERALPAMEYANQKSSIFPNPVTNSFTISLKEASGEVVATILDIKGSALMVRKFAGVKQVNFDASNLKAGQYLVQIQTGKGVEVLKFIKL